MFFKNKKKFNGDEIVKRKISKAFKNDRIFLTIKSMRGKDVTGYNVNFINKNEIFKLSGYSPYWSNIYNCYRPEKNIEDKPKAIVLSILNNFKIEVIGDFSVKIL